MLIDQTKENDILSQKNEALSVKNAELQQQIDELLQKLEDRKIILENAGSIAEASLRLNQVFEIAQAAADEYLLNVRQMCDAPIEPTNQSEGQQMILRMQAHCATMEKETKAKCDEMLEKAKKDSQAYWNQVSSKLAILMKRREDLSSNKSN